MQLSTRVRNARLDAIETTIGASPKLRLYDLSSGAPGELRRCNHRHTPRGMLAARRLDV
jgi:hypothetical protein